MPFSTELPWRIETARLSIFLSDCPTDPGVTWWSQMTGVEPEESTSKRAVGEFVDAGPFEGVRLWLGRNVLAKRVDWIMHPTPALGDEFPALGEFSDWRDRFLGLMDGWLATNELSVVRIGLGVTVVCPVQDREDGYRFLQSALPMIKFEENWSDFSFQVTKEIECPHFADTPLSGSQLNCLSKWNSIILSVMNPEQSMALVPSMYAGRLELDLNTAASNKSVISMVKVREILGALSDISTRYTREGFLK